MSTRLVYRTGTCARMSTNFVSLTGTCACVHCICQLWPALHWGNCLPTSCGPSENHWCPGVSDPCLVCCYKYWRFWTQTMCLGFPSVWRMDVSVIIWVFCAVDLRWLASTQTLIRLMFWSNWWCLYYYLPPWCLHFPHTPFTVFLCLSDFQLWQDY